MSAEKSQQGIAAASARGVQLRREIAQLIGGAITEGMALTEVVGVLHLSLVSVANLAANGVTAIIEQQNKRSDLVVAGAGDMKRIDAAAAAQKQVSQIITG